MNVTVLACVFPKAAQDEQASHYDACSPLQDLVASGLPENVQVKILVNPAFNELQTACKELAPTLLYLSGQTDFEQDRVAGTVGPLQFADGPQSSDAVVEACKGTSSVYLDCSSQDGTGAKLQAAGVQHAIVWPEQKPVPAVVAAQFNHTFFCSLLFLRSSVPEAFALASHVTQAHCTTSVQDTVYTAPTLPLLHSTAKAALPDNSSIAPPSISGLDPSTSLASSVPGWADIRLLAPRAELRLLLTGDLSLIDGAKLSFLGEALRALLVLEMRGLTLVQTTQCTKTPANLPLGCEALRCEVRSASGAEVVAILGGQPSVLAQRTLVEHALRMTLVADSLSLQFRLPPPGVQMPVPRHSAAIAGGVPVVDALVLTSVWAVHVLRTLSQVATYRPLLSLGVAAVGSTATLGVTPLDAQRLKMIVTGAGPGGPAKPAPSTPHGVLAPPPPQPPPPSNDGLLSGHDEIMAGA